MDGETEAVVNSVGEMTIPRMRNILMVGHTPLFTPLVVRLLESGHQVFFVERSSTRLRYRLDRAGAHADRLKCIALDYRDIPRLRRWVEHMQLLYGSLDAAIVRVPRDAVPVLLALDAEIRAYRASPWHAYHLTGPRDRPLPSGLLPREQYHVLSLVSPGWRRDARRQWTVQTAAAVFGALATHSLEAP
ncbi:MAG: hypothetical protein OWU84_01885 [Firmicutes bacterium]|nr:hypothetical protein [Bacillota bacterium]